MEKTYFYFDHNRLLLKASPILLCVLCAFWSLVDILTEDSMFFLKTGAIFGIALMELTGLASFIAVLRLEKFFKHKETDKDALDKLFKICELIVLIFLISITIGSAFVCGSNNYAIREMSSVGTVQSISLSSALLFIPVLMPFAEKRYNYIIIFSIISSLVIPFFMPGRECYQFLPELVLRIAICIALFVAMKRTEDNYELEKKIKNGNTKILSMLVNLIELRDMESGKHVNKVGDYTKILLEKINEKYPEYGFSHNQIQSISEASLTHDIGKVLIPDDILLKPGRLTEEEFEIMKTHTVKGTEILLSLPEEIVESDFLRYSIDICKYHHEKYDGKGYPFGLSGEEIPIWAQVVSIIDCYEALTSERHYKEAYSHDTAVKMILDGECGAFSDKIISCFLDCSGQFREKSEI